MANGSRISKRLALGHAAQLRFRHGVPDLGEPDAGADRIYTQRSQIQGECPRGVLDGAGDCGAEYGALSSSVSDDTTVLAH